MIAVTCWSSDTYSQNGEDGIIATILDRIGKGHQRCIEFGAHDGLTYANTARLWRESGWHAVLIEPDSKRFQLLTKNTSGFDCTILNASVGSTPPDRLEDILRDLGEPPDVDVLSIDIDGDDVRILEALGQVRARVLLCEYNPTIPYWLDIRCGPRTGASIVNVVEVGTRAGYTFLGATLTNALFVADDLSAHFADVETRLPLVVPTDLYTNVVFDFMGRAQVTGRIPFGVRPGKARFDAVSGPLELTEAARSLIVLPRPRHLSARVVGALRSRLPSPRSRKSGRIFGNEDV